MYLVAVPKENPPPVLVAPRVPVPKLKPDILFYVDKRMNPTGNVLSYLADSTQVASIGIAAKLMTSIKKVGQMCGFVTPQNIAH